MIASQNTSDLGDVKDPEWFDDTRPITYRNLNEAMKFVKYKEKAEERDSVQKKQIEIQSRTIDSLVSIISDYKTDLIPTYETELSLLRQKVTFLEELDAIREEKWEVKYKMLRRKRIGLSAYAGYGATLQNLQPSAGLAITYTFIRL